MWLLNSGVFEDGVKLLIVWSMITRLTEQIWNRGASVSLVFLLKLCHRSGKNLDAKNPVKKYFSQISYNIDTLHCYKWILIFKTNL